MNAWHNQSLIELEDLVATDVERGLTDEEVAARLARNEPNKLRKGKRFSAFVILVSQFKSLVIWGRVVRNGHSVMVVATEIVPGNILLRESGNLVTADAHLIQVSVLRINEAPLNGELQAGKKFTDNLPPETALAERENMVFPLPV